MSIDLENWFQDIRGRRWSTIRSPVKVLGRRDKHLGPRWEYAEIEVVADPSEEWRVDDSLPVKDRVEMVKDDWLRESQLGMLDVLVSRPLQPLLMVHLRVVGAKYTFESSRQAFRMAGRDAAEALLASAEVVV